MVNIMENPIKMDDLQGKTHYFRKHPYAQVRGTANWGAYTLPTFYKKLVTYKFVP